MTTLQRLFNDLIRFETELWNAVDARLRAEFGLPLSRFEPLQIISRVDSCRVHDIARELSITVGGTSKLIDRIETAGYCVRGTNPDDLRSSIITLTPAGRRILTDATAAFQDELERRFRLPRQELERFGATLAKLRIDPERTDVDR